MRDGVWNPNGEGERPDIPGGIAKDHARDKRPVIAYACLYPALAAVARDHGYALAMHGSLVADCDLIAVPWVAHAAAHDVLAEALAKRAEGHLVLDDWRDRPAGVRKHVIHLGGGPYLDLCVVPAALRPSAEAPPAATEQRLREFIDVQRAEAEVLLMGNECSATAGEHLIELLDRLAALSAPKGED